MNPSEYQKELDKILIKLLGNLTNWNKEITVCIASMMETTSQTKQMIEYLINNINDEKLMSQDNLIEIAMKISDDT